MTTQFSGQTNIFIENLLTGSIRNTPWPTSFLILLLIVSSSGSTLALLGVLSLNAAWASAAIWRPQREVNVLLAVQADHEGRDVHHLLAHTAKIQRDKEGEFRNTKSLLLKAVMKSKEKCNRD